jgi:FAD/FMN-containing dehydrogenase
VISTEQLRSQIKGRVIEPADSGYDEARQVFAGWVDRRPAHIVQVADADDVARVITFARETDLILAVRSGGHSGAGHSVCDGGIVIDLRRLRELEIDAAGKTAWAQTGLTARDYSMATQEFGLATGFGDTGSVGIGGLTLGGGVGYLSRKYGLTIDDLIAAEVVTADGTLVTADAGTHTDLFWALRGGGGNFGIATRFKLRLHEVGTVYGGMLMLPATADVIESFIAAAQVAGDELTVIGNVMPAPPMPFVPAEYHGRLVIFALMVHAASLETGERALAPFRSLANPIVDMLRPMPYPEIYPPEDPNYRPITANRTMFVDSVDRGKLEAMVEQLEASSAKMRVVQIRVLGGAIARVPVDATAYAHRQRRIMLNIAALYERPEDATPHKVWVDQLWNILQDGKPAAYVNFLTDEGAARVREAYPNPTWEKLATIKARYDPTNLFRLNQNVPPA